MIVVRVLLGVLLAIAAPLAISGFWASSSLPDSDGFADRLADEWERGLIQQEFVITMQASAEEQIRSEVGQGFFGDIAVNLVNDSMESAAESPEFAAVWRQWMYDLHQDLVLIARGGQPAGTSVVGNTVTVNIEPLLEVLVSDELLALGGDRLEVPATYEFVTQDDLAGQLRGLDQLEQARWPALVTAIVVGLLLVLATRPRLMGLGWSMAAITVGSILAAGWLTWGRSDEPPPSPTPLLNEAISAAMTAGWRADLLIAATLSGALAAAALFMTTRRAAAPAESP